MVCLLAAMVGAQPTPAAITVISTSAGSVETKPPAAAPTPSLGSIARRNRVEFSAGPSRLLQQAKLLQQARPYLKDAASLPSAAHAFPGEGAVQLYHLRYEQVEPDGLSALVVQHVYQLRTTEEAELFALDDLWYDSARTSFHLVRAQVLRGGKVLTGRDGGDLRPLATGNQPRQVDLPPLHAGDRVNVVYVLTPRAGDWSLLGGHFLGNLFAFRDSFPSLQVRYVLAARRAMTVSQWETSAPVVTHSEADGGTWTQWSWQVENQPAFFHTQGGPSITDVSPFVQVSGFQSWAELADWYGGVLAERSRLTPKLEQRFVQLAGSRLPLAAPAAAAVAMAPGLTPAVARTRATVARVWGYLSAHLRYAGDESGVHAFVPAPVDKVFQSQSGDCKDGALLLVTWLRAAGVEADLALVRTPEMGKLAPPERDPVTGADHEPATMAAFDHALVYLPATDQWLDTTAPDLLEGELPASDQNSLALIVRPGERELVRVPDVGAQANRTQRVVKLTPAGDGWLRAEGTLIVRGADAPAMRAHYADPSSRVKALQDWLGSSFSHATVESVHVTGAQPARDTVQVRFIARVRPRALTVAWMPRRYAAQLAGQAVRHQLLRIALRWRLDETWSLRLADASACPSPRPGSSSRAPFGEVQISRNCEDGWLNVHTTVIQNTEQVAAGEYPAYRRFWQGVDARLDAALPASPRLLAALRAPLLPVPAPSAPEAVLTAARP